MIIKSNPLFFIDYHPDKKGLALNDLISKSEYILDGSSIIDILSYSKNGIEKNKLKLYISRQLGISDRMALKTISNLQKQGLLIVKKQNSTLIKMKEEWEKYGWGLPFLYHFFTQDYPFLDYSKESHKHKDVSLMKEYSKSSKPPSIYKEIKGSKKFPLENEDILNDIPFSIDIHMSRKTKINFELISVLFLNTFGKRYIMNFPVLGKALSKTSPSGGARHPSEAYLINLEDFNKLPAGIFHYSVKNNCFELLSKDKISTSEVKETFFYLNQFRNVTPKAIIVITSFFERSMWRYREPRSFRAILLDVGHLVTTFRILSLRLGIGILFGDGFNDSKVKKLLKIEDYSEEPLSFICIYN